VGVVVYSPLSVPNSATSAFGLPRGHYPEFLEMSRLCLEPAYNGQNLGSQLVGYSLRKLKKQGIKAVISYADSSRHVGAIYQACNFTYHGLTPQKNDFYFADGRKLSRGKSKGFEGKWIPRPRKHRYVYLLDKKIKIKWPQEAYPKEAT
jgi:GNAT superfamily N-acetyltransferase